MGLDENTCRMPRQELLGLLNTMTPIEQQRITAEIAVATPPPELAIQFTPQNVLTTTRIMVIGASFVVAFTVGLLSAAML